jgi:CubicO group peptidase (beta-lactamase class C family)
MAYSNVGYVVLGAIIEKLRAKPWEDVIREKLFDPLGMSSAGFGPPGERDKIDQPWGHQLLLGAVAPTYSDNRPVMGPAGRVHCSIRDWGKFISLYLDAAQGRPRLVSARMFSELTDPGPGGDYAGGWMITQRDWGGGTVLTHAGSNGMWFCVAWVAPRRGFALLSAVNIGGDDAAQACDEASGAMIGWREKRDAGK